MAERRTWVLDTATKGTGATMVPIEQVEQKPSASGEPFWLPPKRRAPEPKPPEPRAPRRFRVVDVMTRELIADDADARTALQALAGVRSPVDVSVYVREAGGERWRLLTLGEQRLLWDRRPAAH
jgi:hypothetical protein